MSIPTSIVDPNRIVMTGENPFVRLAPEDNDDYTTSISFWRMTFCPAGPEVIRRSYAPDIGADWLGLGYADLDDGYFGRVFVDAYSTTVDADQAKTTRPILYFAARPIVAGTFHRFAQLVEVAVQLAEEVGDTAGGVI